MIYLHCDLPVSPPRTYHIHHDIHDTYICQISPHIPHTSWHTWHIHLSNIWLPERKFVKSLTLLRLKSRFLSRWNPGKFDPKFQQTRSPMRYDISEKKIAGDAAKFWPPAASRGDHAHKLFQFLFSVSQRVPLRKQVVSCFCFCNPYGETHRWIPNPKKKVDIRLPCISAWEDQTWGILGSYSVTGDASV